MCDYCDCRDVAPIRELSEDHDAIGLIAGRLRRALAEGDEPAAGRLLRALQSELGPHLEREESGIFAELAVGEGLAWYLGELRADHAAARADLLGVDPGTGGWTARVVAGLDALAEHIGIEEYDLFPASRLIIDDEGWARVMAAHERIRNQARPRSSLTPA